MFRLFIMTLLVLSSFFISISAEIKPFNNKTTLEIINRLPAILIPANFVFFFSFLIYIFLICWLYGFWRNKHKASKGMQNYRAFIFSAISILHIIYIYLGHYELFISAIVMSIVILLLLSALYFSYPKRENTLTDRLPISLYFGWHLFNFMLLMNYTLTLHEWSGWGISQPLWAVIYLTIMTAIGLHFLYHHNDFALNSVFVIGFIGISIKNGFDSLFVTIAALFLSVVIVVGFFILNDKKSDVQAE